MPRPRKPTSPFRYFNSSPEVIRLAVVMSVRVDRKTYKERRSAALAERQEVMG